MRLSVSVTIVLPRTMGNAPVGVALSSTKQSMESCIYACDCECRGWRLCVRDQLVIQLLSISGQKRRRRRRQLQNDVIVCQSRTVMECMQLPMVSHSLTHTQRCNSTEKSEHALLCQYTRWITCARSQTDNSSSRSQHKINYLMRTHKKSPRRVTPHASMHA